jgi:cytidine deaminase
MSVDPGFTDKMLLELARDMRAKAHAPYSKFTVGASCLGGSGIAYFGCNVENASYPVGICAERVVVASAISHGESKITVLAIAGGMRDQEADSKVRPCGMCLQFISEFMDPDSRVLISDGALSFSEFKLSELLPEGFSLSENKNADIEDLNL